MPPKPKRNVPPASPKRGMHKSRRKLQPPPELQSTADLASMDERATMREFMQMLWNLTTTLATMSSRIDQFEQSKAKSVDITSVQPAAAVSLAQPGTGSHSHHLADGFGVSPA